VAGPRRARRSLPDPPGGGYGRRALLRFQFLGRLDSPGEIRLQLDGGAIILERPRAALLGFPGAAAAAGRPAVFLLQRARRLVVGDRLVPFALVAPHVAAVAVGDRIVRIEADRLAVVGDRAVVFVLAAPGIAAAGQGRRAIHRIESQRLVVIVERAIVLGFAPIHVAAREMGGGLSVAAALAGFDHGRAEPDHGVEPREIRIDAFVVDRLHALGRGRRAGKAGEQAYERQRR